jgi:hypothetical protein
MLQELLGDEQVAHGDRNDSDCHIRHEDANPWKVVAESAVAAELTVFQD